MESKAGSTESSFILSIRTNMIVKRSFSMVLERFDCWEGLKLEH